MTHVQERRWPHLSESSLGIELSELQDSRGRGQRRARRREGKREGRQDHFSWDPLQVHLGWSSTEGRRGDPGVLSGEQKTVQGGAWHNANLPHGLEGLHPALTPPISKSSFILFLCGGEGGLSPGTCGLNLIIRALLCS